MAIADRRLRDRAARRQLIIATARALAEREGWDAVTTRRLSTEIEYSQPVLYKHFASMEDIVEAVALEGFGELAEALSTARGGAGRAGGGVEPGRPRVQQLRRREPGAVRRDVHARHTIAIRLPRTLPVQLRAGFAELREAVANVAGGRDVDTLTEVLWAALHGLTTLGRSDRLRPGRDTERIELLVAQFYDASAQKR